MANDVLRQAPKDNAHGKNERVSSARTIYVQDLAEYRAFQARADEIGISMSELILSALRAYGKNECSTCTRMREVLSTGSVVMKQKKAK
jgi:hypothetical protein